MQVHVVQLDSDFPLVISLLVSSGHLVPLSVIVRSFGVATVVDRFVGGIEVRRTEATSAAAAVKPK